MPCSSSSTADSGIMNLNGQTIGSQGLVTIRSPCWNDFQKYSTPSQPKIAMRREEEHRVAGEVDARPRADASSSRRSVSVRMWPPRCSVHAEPTMKNVP